MGNQEQMLLSLKHDKAMQQRALQEFERNQKLMLTLIAKLEEKPEPQEEAPAEEAAAEEAPAEEVKAEEPAAEEAEEKPADSE